MTGLETTTATDPTAKAKAQATAKALLSSRPKSKAAGARAKNARVIRDAGTQGHVEPEVPTRRFRTDIVAPMLSFVVYGTPAAQGSKRYAGMRGGKPVLKEQSEAVDPWRESVRAMARKATQEWARSTGKPWQAINVPVMASAVVTVTSSTAATQRGDVYATGTPDLDKLERAIGDALAPVPLRPSDGKGLPQAALTKAREQMMVQRRSVCVLHDDSRIVVWDHVCKVYPSTTVDSLGYSGVTIRLWLMSDLDRAERQPLIRRDGKTWMLTADLRSWARPLSGRTWEDEAVDAWGDPGAVLSSRGPVNLRGRGIGPEGIRAVLAVLATGSPTDLVEVAIEQPGR